MYFGARCNAVSMQAMQKHMYSMGSVEVEVLVAVAVAVAVVLELGS